jgi:hypothetical protein
MENVISGKLEYLKMVKGKDNETYRKLNERFTKLFPKKSNNKISLTLDIWEKEGIEKAMDFYYKQVEKPKKVLMLNRKTEKEIKSQMTTDQETECVNMCIDSCIKLRNNNNEDCYYLIEGRLREDTSNVKLTVSKKMIEKFEDAERLKRGLCPVYVELLVGYSDYYGYVLKDVIKAISENEFYTKNINDHAQFFFKRLCGYRYRPNVSEKDDKRFAKCKEIVGEKLNIND